MKKLIVKVIVVLFIVFGFKMIVIEPDKPHTYEVTIPSFSDITDFFDEVGDAAEEIAKDFKAVPVVKNENGDVAAVDHSAASP